MKNFKILIIRFSSRGDVVLTSAFIRCLKNRYPEASLHYLTRDDMAELLADSPFLDKLHVLPREYGAKDVKSFAKELNLENFEMIFDLHASLRSRLVCSKIKRKQIFRVKKKTFKRALLTSFNINLLKHKKLNMLEYIDQCQKWGLEYDGKGTEIHWSKKLENEVEQILIKKKSSKTQGIIGIAPGALWPMKAWDREKYESVVKSLSSDGRFSVYLFGGPDESDFNDWQKYENVFGFCGELSLLGSAYLASKIDLMVCNDSLMLHLAEAVGVDVVSIFGPTSREFGFFPHRKKSIVHEIDLACRPCDKMGSKPCRFARRHCMDAISAEMVLRSVLSRF